MKLYTRIFVTLSLAALLCNTAHAIVIISDDYLNFEGAHIEILHNPETNKGTVITRQANCNTCKPITLTYSGSFIFSVDGHPEVFTAQTPSIGKGDISYNPDDLSVGHINLYSE